MNICKFLRVVHKCEGFKISVVIGIVAGDTEVFFVGAIHGIILNFVWDKFI